jgi:PKD repeat protein
MEAISSMRVSSILESAKHYHPKMPFEIPSKGDHIPLGRIDQTYEKMICTQAPLALKTDPTKEGYAMKKHLPHSHKCFAAFLYLLFFVVCLLMLPIQTIACTDSGRVIRTINVVASDSVNFTYTPASPVKGQPVQFTDTSTGSPILWRWDFGDGTGTTSTSKNPSYTYTTGGTYMVTLTVLYSSGPERAGQMVTVVSELTASFTYSPSSPAEGQAVQFTDTSSGSPTSWQWSFGDGAYSTSQNPSHTYTAAVTYTITLTVTNSSGSKSMSQTITVVPVFAASFTYSPSSPVEGQAVQFTDTSIGSPTSWQWNFGDGATNTSQNPSHPYAVAGCYDMYLTIMKGTNSDTTRRAIIVRRVITAASPSYADVSAAISSASSGDTIIVPAGTATWTSQLIIAKPISVIGAGVGNTVITSTVSDFFLKYAPPAGTTTLFRLSGFTFQHGSVSSGFWLHNTDSLNPIRNVRIDHNSFLNTSGNPSFEIDGPVYGVIDNNTITGFSHMDNLGQCRCSDWIPTFELGTEDNIYWEDNNITSSYTFCTGGHGGRYCYRHNTFTYNGSVGQFPAFDMHGNQPSGVVGPRGGEIYENTIYVVGTHDGRLFMHRGGTMVIYNNYYHYRAYDFRISEEYCNSITCGGVYDMTVKNSYYWNNFNNGVLFDVSNIIIDNGCGEYQIKEGQNFWVHRAAFDGTVGMGVGPVSSRPSSGLVVGVGYWATDENKLYRATGPTTWGLYYTPYTYPHPLRNKQ